MVPCGRASAASTTCSGQEGFDNDGDGFVNEDADGGYDPNRNWPWRWAPQYVQGGSTRTRPRSSRHSTSSGS